MFGTPFGHGTLRKYVVFFGTLFNNVWLQRYDQTGALIQNMKVPLNYGPREKFLARADGNPDSDRPIAIQLPRMSFEMSNMYYDSLRKTSSLNKLSIVNPLDSSSASYQYNPVPYNIDFTLSIMVKNAEDGTYILEQILPYFTPDWTATLNINTDLGQKHDVPVILQSVSSEDTYEGNFESRRAMIWTLTFTMKGWLFGPTKSNGPGSKLIKEIDINFLLTPSNVSVDEANTINSPLVVNVDIKPGMFANGTATTQDNNIWTYRIANSSGTFVTGEKLSVNSSMFTYVIEANSTAFSSRDSLPSNSALTGAYSGYTAVISSSNVAPPLSISSNSIYANSSYGFIVDFTEY